MAELMGVIASGIGIASFAIQLAESVQKLKALCDDIKDAPETITLCLEQLDILTLQVQEVASEEQENPQIFASSPGLRQCITLCKQGTAALAGIVNKLEKEMTTGKKIWGKLKVVLKKDTLRKLASRLESARGSLMMSYMIYSNALHRLDTRLLVTEVRKARISTHRSPLTTNEASVGSLTSSVSSSLQLHSTHGQDKSIAAVTTTLQDDKNILFDKDSVSIYDTRGKKVVQRTNYRLRLPFWFTNRAWEVTISRPPGGWDTKFRTYNIIPKDSPLFVLCEEGNLQGVQALFSSGEASPFDVDSNGATALHYAVNHFFYWKDDRLTNITKLSHFIIRQGLDPEQYFRDCFDALATNLTMYGSSSADIDGFVEWIRVCLSGIQLDVAPVHGEEQHFLAWATDVDIVEEIMRRANDLPFEHLTIDKRLSLAIRAHYPTALERKRSRNVKTLDLFAARLGGETTGLAIETIFNGQHDVVYALSRLMEIYGNAVGEGDPRAEVQLLGILEAAIEHGIDLHGLPYDYMAVFVNSYCDLESMEYKPQLSARARQSAIEKMAQDAVQVWLKFLSRAHVDLRLFWEEEISVEHVLWYESPDGGSFEDARIIILGYGSRPEDCQVMISWRLNDNIPEASAGDFWDMLEHPERRMPGFLDDELDSRYYYRLHEDRRSWPNRHERRKGMLERDDLDLYKRYLCRKID